MRDPACQEITTLVHDLCTGACKVWKANDWTAGLSNKYTEKRSKSSSNLGAEARAAQSSKVFARSSFLCSRVIVTG